jgi:LuxR family maltose regulon positive regulatory protein
MSRGVSGIAFIPRLPESLVERPALIERVATGARRPLLIVRSPAGGGKSTALAAWAAAHPGPGVWVALDRSAGDRFAFWRRVIDTVLRAGVAPPTSALRDIVASPEVENGLAALLLRGFAEVPEPITLVIDDYHHVGDPAIHEDLHWLLTAGAGLQVVIATRAVSELESPERMAKVDTAVLLSDTLAFQQDEVARAAQLFAAPDAAQELYSAFAGWPLPTRAALVQLGGGRAPDAASAIERVRATATSFVLEQANDAGYRQFLLRISIPARLTEDLALRLGGPDALTHLSRAEREGVGTWSAAAGVPEFAMHPYLREQLESEFVSLEPERAAAARREYAKDLIERREVMEAARQLTAIGDLDALVALLRRFFTDLLMSGGMLGKTLALIPESELRKYPELLAIRALGLNVDPRTPLARLGQLASLVMAAASARMGRGTPEERLGILMAVLAAQRLSGHYDQALKTAERIVPIVAFLDDEARAAVEGLLSVAWNHVATTLFYDEQADRAAESFTMAAEAAAAADQQWVQLHATSMLSLILAMRGDMTSLAPRLEVARARRSPAGWAGTYTASGYHLAEAMLALERFDAPAALAQLEQLSQHEPRIEHWPLFARVRALSSLVAGKPHLGLHDLSADIAAHADRPPTSKPMSGLLTVTRAELLLADDQPNRAIDEVRGLRRGPAVSVVLARANLALGEESEAVRLAAPIAWAEDNVPRTKAEALLVVAAAFHRLGQRAEADQATTRAVALLEAFGLRRPLMAVPRAELVALLESAGIPHDELLAGVPDLLRAAGSRLRLTATELRVLALLAQTGRVDDLAAQLHLSANTIKTHLKRIYRKLGVSSRAAALAAARLHGLIPD